MKANEEKAKEITKDYSAVELDSKTVIYEACVEIAQWKDEQFKAEKQALIDKTVKYLAPIAYTHKHLINLDDFIEYMKEKQ